MDLAAALRVSVRTIDRMVAAGELPVRRLGRKVLRFHWPDVLEAMKQ